MMFNCEVKPRGDGFAVEWCEARAGIEWCVMQVAKGATYAGMLAAVAGGIALFVVGSPVLVLLAAMLFCVSYGLACLAWRVPAKWRAIHFAKGRVFDGSSDGAAWWAALTDVAGFEVEQVVNAKAEDEAVYTHGVRMLLRTGRIRHIASDLEPDDAHMLAFTLAEVREGMRFEVGAKKPAAQRAEPVY